MGAMNHTARYQLAFAGAARTIFASIGQAHALPNARCQQGLVVVCGKRASTGLHCNGENNGGGSGFAHLLYPMWLLSQ